MYLAIVIRKKRLVSTTDHILSNFFVDVDPSNSQI